MLVTNNTVQDYFFGPLHLPGGVGQTLTVDDTSSTSLYLTNDQVADAINNLSQFGSNKITVSSYALPFPRPTGVPQLLHGDGSPEGLIYAAAGSLYMRRDVGSTGANGLYVKTTGITISTGWQVYTVASAVSGLIQLYDSGYIAAPQLTLDTRSAGFSTAFTHLIVKLIARGDNASNSVTLHMNFNGDTGTNYDSQGVWGGQNPAAAVSQLSGTFAYASGVAIPAANAAANYPGIVELEVPYYSQPTTNFYKMWTSKYGAGPNFQGGVDAGWWKNAGTAIQQITFALSAGHFIAGSRLMVYAYN
jgi:hypothetical protein